MRALKNYFSLSNDADSKNDYTDPNPCNHFIVGGIRISGLFQKSLFLSYVPLLILKDAEKTETCRFSP